MKFQIGDKAIVVCNAGDGPHFLKHFFEIGKEVEIAEPFYGWKHLGHEAYRIKGSSEILLAGELEHTISTYT